MTKRSKKASEAVLGDDGKTVGEGNLFARSSFSVEANMRGMFTRKTPDRKGGWLAQISLSKII